VADRVDLPTYRTLLVTADRGVSTITLNRPRQRNAVGDGMREELADAYRRCDRDDSIRVVVVTGTPPAFCAGADLSAGERTFTEPGPTFSAAGIDVPAWTLSKPVIAAVNGHAIGLGLTLRCNATSGTSRPTGSTASSRFGAGWSATPTRTGCFPAWSGCRTRPRSC
jgi:enoyl-CoA hydratase/carnithine racemase